MRSFADRLTNLEHQVTDLVNTMEQMKLVCSEATKVISKLATISTTQRETLAALFEIAKRADQKADKIFEDFYTEDDL